MVEIKEFQQAKVKGNYVSFKMRGHLQGFEFMSKTYGGFTEDMSKLKKPVSNVLQVNFGGLNNKT